MKRIILLFTIVLSLLSFGQSDCTSALSVCGNSGFSYTPVDSGNVDEDLGGCLVADEHLSVWYTFTVATDGTLAFLITPETPKDYDWAVYAAGATCDNLGTPIRCNFDGLSGTGATGLDLGITFPDSSTAMMEGFMNVQAGQTYILVIDNYPPQTPVTFSLQWSGTATLESAFDDPSVQPNPFIAPGPAQDGVLTICSSPELFDFSTLSDGILNGNPNFSVTYHLTQNDALTGENPITTPINVTVGTTYYYTINYTDPNDPDSTLNNCRQTGEITFQQGNIPLNDATLTACNNNDSGVGIFNLDDANVYAGPGNIDREYYPSLADLNAGTNQITNPQVYESAEGSVFVKVTTEAGCFNNAEITLQFLPAVQVEDKQITSCFIPEEPSTALFDLTGVEVTTTPGVTFEYYLSEQDAIDSNNPIANPSAYISVATDVYVKVTNSNSCYNIAKIKLIVTPPTYSEVLKDQIVCLENVARLDAGPDFDAYEWSTGATTSSIDNVTVGTYWVNLTKNGCVTRQEVKVIASPVPVITDVKIKENTMEVIVEGGTKPYQYSLDGENWQESNTFENLPRGQNVVFVKDAYDCQPVVLPVTIPDLLNVITPNGDGFNDVIDYSALSYKKTVVFQVYDRYNNRIFINKKNQYTWDGRFKGGKRVPTGTYWYSLSWINPITGTPFIYKGWIMVKNR